MDVRKYPVYDYMKFIWRKKLYLIGFTILCMIVAAVFSFTRNPVYTTTASFFTGNAENDLLSKPDLIAYKYGGESELLKAQVPEPFQIKLTAAGADKEKTETYLKKAAKEYFKDLSEHFDRQYDARKSYVDAIKGKIEENEEAISLYTKLVAESKDVEKLNFYTEILVSKQETLDDYRKDMFKAQYQLSLAEKPELLNISSVASSNNLLRNTILAGAFGFQLMLIFLVFWKYVINAKRYED